MPIAYDSKIVVSRYEHLRGRLVCYIIPVFGSISQERDDEADFVDFLYQGIAKVVQLNLNIMYEALCVLGIPGEGVNSKFLWLLRPMR